MVVFADPLLVHLFKKRKSEQASIFVMTRDFSVLNLYDFP